MSKKPISRYCPFNKRIPGIEFVFELHLSVNAGVSIDSGLLALRVRFALIVETTSIKVVIDRPALLHSDRSERFFRHPWRHRLRINTPCTFETIQIRLYLLS
jgi:hypothetical protein